MSLSDDQLQQLLDRQEITDLLYRRARAGDRRDLELALSCYHDGATEEHEGFTGSVETFLRERSLTSPHSTAPVTCLWHFISNILIDLRGDEAAVESYHIAVVEAEPPDGEATRSIIGGRYLDEFAKRDGRWAITHRSVVFDWSRVEPITAGTAYWDLMGHDTSKILFGDFGPNDPLYELLGVNRGA
jgi:hypothetical protein